MDIDITDRLKSLEKELSDAQREEAIAEARREAAESSLKSALETLKIEFSLDSVVEAKAKLDQLKAEFEAKAIEVENKFRESL